MGFICKLSKEFSENMYDAVTERFREGGDNIICSSPGLPIFELTTTANTADSSVALDILSKAHCFLPVTECTFLADKGYDVKNIYN